MGGRAAIVALLLLAVGLSGLAHEKLRRDLAAAGECHVEERHTEALIARRDLEQRFRSIYEGLRTVARLPGVRALPSLRPGTLRVVTAEVPPDSLAVVREVAANLAASASVARLTIAPYPFDPDGLDPAGRLPRSPVLRIDSAPLPGFRPDGEAGPEVDDTAENRLILRQLQWLAQNHFDESTFDGIDPPAISGPEVGSGGAARFAAGATRTDDLHGLVYSVPFYGEDGELCGCVSAVIPAAAIRALLPSGDYAVSHPTYGVAILGDGDGTAAAGRDFWSRGEPDPDRRHSEVLTLAIADADEKWSLWTSTPDAVFLARAEVRNATTAAFVTHGIVWAATIPLALLLELAFRERRRFAARMNDLEASLRDRAGGDAAPRRNLAENIEAKSAFLARMSHEIRTPMSAILGFTDLLCDPETSEKKRSDAIETIRRNGRHLLGLINDILDLSKIEAGKLEIERLPVKPRAIVRDVVDLLRDRAEARHTTLGTEIRAGVPEEIETDPTRLRQALVNLVANAIKFTEGGDVRIVVECERADQMIVFHVIDDGIGMTSAQVAKIFQPFSQADPSTARRFGGTGLGLTITKSIAELLQGDIRVISQPGKGSTFSLRVATGTLDGAVEPVEAVEPPEPAEAPQPVTLPEIEGRVLLVEDGPDSQAIIAYMLKRAGAEVMVASNGQEGAELALAASRAGRPFDVILMDMEMPVLDGYQATRWLREEGYHGQVIALTAHAMKGDLDKCIAAGCDHYLSKPIERAVLVREIAHRAGLRSAAKPLPTV